MYRLPRAQGERHQNPPKPPSHLSAPDVTALCAAGQQAFRRAGGRRVPFAWRGKRYVASRTNFRLLINNAAGAPVCCRWF